jgi:hypothetical protein
VREARAAGLNVLWIADGSETPAGWRTAQVGNLELIPRGPLTEPVSRWIMQICAALLRAPEEREHREWLAAMIHLAILVDTRRSRRDTGMPRILKLLLDERPMIKLIEAALRLRVEQGQVAARTDIWAAKLQSLIGPDWDRGKRDPAIPYTVLTDPMMRALTPFLEGDTTNRLWLDDLLNSKRFAAVLRLPRDLETLAAVIPAIQRRLEHALSHAASRSVILIDDWTRVSGLDATRLISTTQRGNICVLCGEGAAMADLYGKADAQIWVMPLDHVATGALNRQLGQRPRRELRPETVARQSSHVRSHVQNDGPYFHDADLKSFPAAKRPAIVLLKESRAAKPILVDLND